MKRAFIALSMVVAFAAVVAFASEEVGPVGGPAAEAVTVYGYDVVATYPHDILAFTEGLVYENGTFYEGTGLYAKSLLRQVEIETGEVLRETSIDPRYFGEGVAVIDDRIFQLTWRSKKGFVYDKESFKRIGDFSYSMEGWGLTTDGSRLIMSDGSDTLHIIDPDTFKEVERIRTRYNGGSVGRLNELEYIDGMVYANLWPTDDIAIISLETGRVTGKIELKGLLSKEEREETDVLNGIAWDAEGERLFVTGKYWPKVFEIELVPKE